MGGIVTRYRERDWDDYRAALARWRHGTPLERRCNAMPTLWSRDVRLGPPHRGVTRAPREVPWRDARGREWTIREHV